MSRLVLAFPEVTQHHLQNWVALGDLEHTAKEVQTDNGEEEGERIGPPSLEPSLLTWPVG